jgi:hypothetical protein
MKPKARQKPRDIDKSPDRISQNISITHAQHLTHMSHISGYVSKPILKKKILTKCQSEVSEIVDANKLPANVCIIIVFLLFKIEISFKFPPNLE